MTKRRPGRPREQARRIRVVVYLLPDDEARVRAAAEREGGVRRDSLSRWVERAVLRALA